MHFDIPSTDDRLIVETDYMPRKTFWRYAQQPASDPRVGPYAGKRMNYPTWWIDPDYEDDVHDHEGNCGTHSTR